MLKDTINIIQEIAKRTRKILLFHSAAGKDSIALLNLCASYFDQVICVFMYIVPDLEHINKYIYWAEHKYPNVKFIQYPHYCIYTYIKYSHLGIKQDPKQRLYKLMDINAMAVENTGISWTFFGFKQSDSLNRRLMLRTYESEAINKKSQKVYPLSHWKNKDVLTYIDLNNLIKPIQYTKQGQSQGTDVNDINFLLWCRENYPGDLKKIFNVFPQAEQKLFENKFHYENRTMEVN